MEPLDNNDKHVDHKRRVKFKIVSLKVKGDMDYVPELVCLAVSNSEIVTVFTCLVFVTNACIIIVSGAFTNSMIYDV